MQRLLAWKKKFFVVLAIVLLAIIFFKHLFLQPVSSQDLFAPSNIAVSEFLQEAANFLLKCLFGLFIIIIAMSVIQHKINKH
ncbi:MAG: hypothetical protein ABI597_10415 [Gammaproteobacteria bacterium]